MFLCCFIIVVSVGVKADDFTMAKKRVKKVLRVKCGQNCRNRFSLNCLSTLFCISQSNRRIWFIFTGIRCHGTSILSFCLLQYSFAKIKEHILGFLLQSLSYSQILGAAIVIFSSHFVPWYMRAVNCSYIIYRFRKSL